MKLNWRTYLDNKGPLEVCGNVEGHLSKHGRKTRQKVGQ